MNFNPASVVAAAAAAAHQTSHHHPYLNHQQLQHRPVTQQQQLIPLPVGGGGSLQVGGGDTSPKIMEWTNDDALELIEQYRCHTELWNRADPKYKDKLCRFRAWSEIAERFGCSKAEVERKMNVLLTQYRREKHKMFVKIYQGIQPNPSKWYAFKRFDFMEAGGGSLSGGGSGGSGVNTSVGNLVPNPVSSSAAAAAHNGLNGLAAAAVAAAAYESGTIAAAGNGGAPPTGPGGGVPGSQPAMQHRRIKTKELKYFGAMGLNIPMLIASSQTLDSWNTAGQYSPPISGSGGGGSERGGSGGGVVGGGAPAQQLRVPLPMSYHGGAGSSSSDFQQSPLKTMDTSDNEDNNNTKEDVAAAAALGQLAAKVERRSPVLVDMAQDLRVAQAKANFGAFVLPPRGSDASTPAMPLNMRKLTGAGSAGHMLMNSLLGSRESMSDGEEPDPDNDEATESAASPGHIKSSVSAQAAVAASAFYAESLNRDDCDFIGSNVSLKLRTMDRTQRIIAEKLISEVLYYGQFNELERSARIQPK
ncbi:hypothetical protein M5D96_003241 [Drosophila gunungcola]|uniref:MADF domain-containing protein n=1 Tax=Drosophila gunungcola TaxID=103775 RepID=A0A9Q0BS66_9MUSC|nr:hypothetical protein M5D96_003241 [Drosophila gunungcola]